jgi:hypothetical protein
MVVRLDLPRDGDARRDLDDAGPLAGTDEDPRTLGRKCLQVHAARLIGAVLAPHNREHGELDERRFTLEVTLDRLELVVG